MNCFRLLKPLSTLMESRRAIVGTSLLLLALPFSAEASPKRSNSEAPKPAWRWTLEERLQARADMSAKRISGEALTIKGASTPELFLPSELYRRLIRIAFSDSEGRDIIRQDLETRARAGGVALPPDFWPLLEGISLKYVESRKTLNLLNDNARSQRDPDLASRLTKQIREAHSESCLLLSKALTTARNTLGPELMDHFLYATVAPTSFITILDEEDAETLRHREGGCK